MFKQLVITGALIVGLTTVAVTEVHAKHGSGPIVEHFAGDFADGDPFVSDFGNFEVAASSPDAATCQAADGTYQIGCRLVPGRPDGWFVPTDVAISSPICPPIVPGNVR